MVQLKQQFLYLPDGSIDIDAWLNRIGAIYTSSRLEIIKKAIDLTKKASEGLTTFYGQSYIEQGLVMGEILAELGLDENSVAAGILASTAEHTHLKSEIILQKTNEEVNKLMIGFSQLNTLHSLFDIKKSRNILNTDRLRKMFLAMSSDIRVIIIKLAERTCMMRGIKNINLHERKRLAIETMEIYAPLANRLGIGQLKWELEDTAFHYTNTETYKKIANFLAERRLQREERINAIIENVKQNIQALGIDAEVNGRAKHIYSIYLKMQKKHLELTDIFDYSAIRILVPTVEDCYAVLSLVHSLWEHIPEEFDDYISHPKINGYRSIHTAVRDKDQKTFEIQIRTFQMHEEAEHGVAAHWVYKESKLLETSYTQKIALLRQILAWHKDLSEIEREKPNNLFKSILEDRVYVFTPAGDIIDLPNGATPLDFAYYIHSEVGHQCRGAKIHGHIVPLTYVLKTGDTVEIITISNGTPSRDWLKKENHYLKTARARAKVASWFKHQDQPHLEAARTARDPKENLPIPSAAPLIHTKKLPAHAVGFQVGDTDSLLTRVALCCKPIPGDEIIGYITQGRGISIHKIKCSTFIQKNPEKNNRFIEVAWDNKNPGIYYSDIQIKAYGNDLILKEITSMLANLKVDLAHFNSTKNKINNIITITITIQIQSARQLDQILSLIKQLPNVLYTKRINA